MPAKHQKPTEFSHKTSPPTDGPNFSSFKMERPERMGPNNKIVFKGRAGRPKVKTGCFTCKARHVKCDEAKPHCNRCLRFGVACDGYPSGDKTTQPRTRLAPKNGHCVSSKPPEKLPIYSSLYQQRLESQEDGYCFRVYCEQVAAEIKGPFKSSLWDRIIPQASEVEPFVRYAVMAIGALSKINNNPRNNLDPGLRDLSSKDQSASYAFALRQYDKALSLMRKAIAEGEHDLRRALIACVLVFCFETLQGNQASAVMHAQSGLLLLMQRVVAHKVPFKPSPLLQERDVMEEDFMNAFQSLDLQVLFFPDRRPACTHHCAIAMCNKFIALLPAELHTIEGARSEWIIIMRRNYHFHTIALVVGKARGLGGPWNTQPLNDSSANMIPGENVFATVKEPPDELLDDQLRYREDIRSWSRACSSLFERVNRFGTMQERAVATILKMNALMNNIMLAGLFFSTETEYDIFLPEFRAIVGMVEFLILGDGPTLLYHFDLGMLVALFLVGLRCRDRETRGRAIDLMEANLNSRQGIWDVRINALVTSWIRDVEEESMDEYGNIPEEKRAIVTGADIDILGKRVVMTCTHRTKQGLIFRYKSVAW